jgi:hypothetical protein
MQMPWKSSGSPWPGIPGHVHWPSAAKQAVRPLGARNDGFVVVAGSIQAQAESVATSVSRTAKYFMRGAPCYAAADQQRSK